MTIQLKTPIVERTYTSDEFEKMPEFDENFELIDGRLVQKPMPVLQHGRIAKRLLLKYFAFDPDDKIGEMLQEVSVKLGHKNVPLPDVSFWTTARKLEGLPWQVAPVPNVAIEIWSEHDWETKKRQGEARAKVGKYQAAGVELIWLIHPKDKTVEVYHADPNTPMQTLIVGDELSGEGVIPGFKLKVAEIFE